jgi:outer membrane protein assembly factor BamB
VSFAIFVAGLKLIAELQKRVPDPKTVTVPLLSRSMIKARRTLLIGGGLLIGVVCAASFLVTRDLPGDFRFLAKSLGLGGYPSLATLEANWPFFRGAAAGGAPAGGSEAEAFAKGPLRELWRAPIGLPGSSSPIVWDNRLYVTGATADQQAIVCLDAITGGQIWERSTRDLLGRTPVAPDVSEDTGWAAPTPACDGKRLFVMFASGQLICMDLSGILLWYKDFGTPENPYGIASSPVLWEDEVIVQFDQSNMSLVVAFQSSNGRLLWRHERKLHPSWATPILVDDPPFRALVVVGNPKVEALDPDSGKTLWESDCMSGETAPSAAYAGRKAFAVTSLASAFAIACTPSNGGKPGTIAWSYEEDLPDISSPLATGAWLYLASSSGTVSCLDAGTGRLAWKERFDSPFSSSAILVGGIVFLVDKAGTIHRFMDSDVYAPLDEVRLGRDVVCTPAYRGGRLYLRAGESIVCIGRGG